MTNSFNNGSVTTSTETAESAAVRDARVVGMRLQELINRFMEITSPDGGCYPHNPLLAGGLLLLCASYLRTRLLTIDAVQKGEYGSQWAPERVSRYSEEAKRTTLGIYKQHLIKSTDSILQEASICLIGRRLPCAHVETSEVNGLLFDAGLEHDCARAVGFAQPDDVAASSLMVNCLTTDCMLMTYFILNDERAVDKFACLVGAAMVPHTIKEIEGLIGAEAAVPVRANALGLLMPVLRDLHQVSRSYSHIFLTL